MKLLKELFSFDDYDSNDEYGPEDGEEEFDFDFDLEGQGDSELDFDPSQYSEEEDVINPELEDGYGAEEDYPEGMMDMPHDDYTEDGEGGLESEEGIEGEIEDIKGEIEGLYARLGKLAAAGDLDLADGAEDFEDVDMDDGDSDFASFRDAKFGEDEMPDFDEERSHFDDDDGMMGFEDEEDEHDLPLDRPEFR